jgi:hypothetical protein
MNNSAKVFGKYFIMGALAERQKNKFMEEEL